MKKVLLCVGLALATIGGISTLLQAQATPTSAAPTTPPPMETPDPKLYGIPNATPVGMPAYTLSPPAGSAVEPARRPMTSGDCDNGRWKSFSALNFKSQAGCRAWVSQHSAGTPGAQKAVTRSPAITPRPRRTPVMKPPSGELTPGSSITPLLDPTPR